MTQAATSAQQGLLCPHVHGHAAEHLRPGLHLLIQALLRGREAAAEVSPGQPHGGWAVETVFLYKRSLPCARILGI